ncbi:ABC transporter ATP-binding protein [Bifidobacterium lemurum]|uniref:ABC transporter ATP-binding protein n=1 Tax=Bifidobacterium lemurum TaxID=1603886 RepID=A0A261FMX8_9BIFI|nr:ABC transporter ATP-binding protein [Bifidobacterium lemurum]OZG60531.1 ABC transporter ATP-binding protein [Bifidobacterium lemurum]QOL34453.1 ABC transporter ATP-binding protein [Bifidobacterium lemurum]
MTQNPTPDIPVIDTTVATDAPATNGALTDSNTPNADATAESPAQGDAVNATIQPPILAMEKVSYSYTRGGKKVVSDLTHAFRAGEVTAITGPSGAGKTTVLSLLSGLTSPTSGRILYDGADLAKSDRYRFRSHDIGVIFQSFNLLPALTVEENIVLSMEASGKRFDRSKHELVVELLDKVRLPEEYANERILHLSGGEQQRVAIARALSYEPQIILADEPTGNLDMATQDDIMAIFRDLAHGEGKCVIIVTHSPAVADQSDTVFELKPLRRAARPKPQGWSQAKPAGAQRTNRAGSAPAR